MTNSILAARMDAIPFAGIRKVFERAGQIEAEGRKVIHFEIGRPDFDTPGHIKEAAKSALDRGLVHYAPNFGIPGLRQALVRSIADHRKVSYDAKNIMVTAGAQEGIILCLQAILNTGDEVLVPSPGFGQYYTSVPLAGGVAVPYALNPVDFGLDEQSLESKISEKTKAIIVNSPHNPTGAVLSKAEIEGIARLAQKHNLLVLSDEAYDRMVYEGAQHFSIAAEPGMKERTMVIGSFSKTYSMTGWRIGYVAASSDIIGALVRLQQNIMLSVCTFAQVGAQAALEGPQDCVSEMTGEFLRRRDAILSGIEKVPGLSCSKAPQGAFYVFVNHREITGNSQELTELLLEKAAVATVPGTEFGPGGEGHIRISYATSLEDCEEGMNRIRESLASL